MITLEADQLTATRFASFCSVNDEWMSDELIVLHEHELIKREISGSFRELVLDTFRRRVIVQAHATPTGLSSKWWLKLDNEENETGTQGVVNLGNSVENAVQTILNILNSNRLLLRDKEAD